MFSRFTIPIIIILLSLNLIIFNIDFYEKESNYDSSEIKDLLSYFSGSELNPEYTIEETIHLKDVRNLIWVSWGLIILLSITLFFSPTKDIIYGGIISLIITLFLPVIFLSFDSAFILFHKLLFTNNYWLLPSTSKLIQMLPEKFFIEAAKQLIFNNLILSLFTIILGIKIRKGIKQ
ncbi:DUF1461 domain-containing protein [Candidatus Woesearchaeota archaeon]|nr:DUF1461 domain-containing protein [Candidatus Woesearchaeota archaeon]